MSQVSANPESRWGDAVALILLGAAGVAAWWGDFGSDLLWLAPAVAVAALAAAGRLGSRPATAAAIVWLPTSILLAGLPAGTLAPAALDTTTSSLRDGLGALPTLDSATPALRAWALAATLLLAGTAWILAGIAWRSRRWDASLVGFALLVSPAATALATGQTADSAWPGAVVLVAVVLRGARGRLVPIAVAGTMVGAVALLGAQVAAPSAGWRPFGHHDDAARFHELRTRQTYGPLEGRRTGAVMLDVTSPRPALWRMQVLEAFDGRHWRVANEDSHLPQPGLRPQSIDVEVRGLRNMLIVSPGPIAAVRADGGTASELGYARVLVERPSAGQTYRVAADAVHATTTELAGIQIPTGGRYLAMTQVGLGPLPVHVPSPLAKWAGRAPLPLRRTDWARVFRLSARLSAGAGDELGVVRRVEAYLARSGRFHYTTDVGAPGSRPLLEFLFHTHRGYCQHFAGAAALLLRVAGVPSRVAVGFATGEPVRRHTWAVRDEDAHAWIEVYFPSVGWVPFNPTPASADADVAAGLDPLEAAAAPAGGGGFGTLAAGAATLFLLIGTGAALGTRHRRRARLGDLLVALAPPPASPRSTLRSLRPALAEIGPATAELALVAERARFASGDSREPSHPRVVLVRALLSDAGLRPAVGLMLRALRTTARPR